MIKGLVYKMEDNTKNGKYHGTNNISNHGSFMG